MIKAAEWGVVIALLGACSPSSPARPQAAAEIVPGHAPEPETPAHAPEAVPGPETLPGPDSAPDSAPDSEPEPEPELVAPDGTRMKPCAGVPEAMACIPGGPFLRGSDDGPTNARPQGTIWVQTFYMDVDEVTYAQYGACVASGGCEPSGPKYTDFDRPLQPINGVSWFDARKYCQAQGKRLPTEAEWEKAARGTEGELHPWGNEPATCELAIIMDERGRSCGVPKTGESPEKGRPWEVGSRPAYRYGLRDMSGNSWEWVADWYSQNWDQCGKACAGVDPLGPCGGKDECRGHIHRVVRGGSWYWPASYATGTHRRFHVPHNRPFHHFGFRCAKDLP